MPFSNFTIFGGKGRPYTTYTGILIDILYTLDSASNYSAIQKLKP